MKKTVLIFGLISGLICSLGFMLNMGSDFDMDKGMIIGFASMIIAFSLIFVATAQYKKQNGGSITFWKAFLIGLYIALISSTIYVIAWLITYYNFQPDFIDKYSNCVIQKMKDSGAAQSAVEAKITEMKAFKESYKKPAYIIAMTYMEILPLGIVVSLINGLVAFISSLLKKRKQNI